MSAADGQLLRRFVADQSESAFEELVGRHGRMVFGVCRRLLNDPHDAEDAFQATFLVLVRRAPRLRKSGSVASWLYGVALRVALNAKRRAASRREHERRVAEMTRTESEAAWRDLGPVLDEELRRLPERLRAPVVLCYLENKSTEEAARELGWTHGALRGRLAKARDLLRGRLSRRGIAVGAALLALLISENASAATVPPACIASTVHALGVLGAGGALASAGLSGKAASLAEEALRGILWTKVRVVASVLVLGAGVLVATALVARELSTGEPVPVPVAEDAVAAAPAYVGIPEPAEPRESSSPADEVSPRAGLAGRKDVRGRPRAESRAVREAKVAEVEEPLAAADLPQAVLRSLGALYPGAEIKEVEKKAKVYEVELQTERGEARLELSADGEVLRAEEEIDVAELPQAVADAVARLYPQATVKEAERDTRGGETVFEVELEDGGRDFDVKLTPEGEVVEDERADVQDEDEDEDEDGDEDEDEEQVDDGDEQRAKGEGESVGPAEGAGAEVF